MDFGEALKRMRDGCRVRRTSWKDIGPAFLCGAHFYVLDSMLREERCVFFSDDLLADNWVVTYDPKDPLDQKIATYAKPKDQPFSNASLQAVMNSFEREMAALKTRVEALESEVHPNVNSPFHPTLWQKSALAALRGEAYPAWLFGHRRTPTQPPVRPTDNPAFPTGHPQSTPNDWIH